VLFSIAALDRGRDACVAAGAVPAIRAALGAHPGNAGVAVIACRALVVFNFH
jgi:hypothetical protein